MHTKLFVNLPVKDLNRSKEFFSKLGFNFDPKFTDSKAACMVIGEDNYAMLLTEPFFKNFTKKKISDSMKSTEAIIALSADSKEQVDDIVTKAKDAGGSSSLDKQETDGMYSWGFQDPDGHLWEVFYMDQSTIH